MAENGLSAIVDGIVEEMERINGVRDDTLTRSRARRSGASIRAMHRHEMDEAAALLAQARQDAAAMVDPLAAFPDLYYTGYTQDAPRKWWKPTCSTPSSPAANSPPPPCWK